MFMMRYMVLHAHGTCMYNVHVGCVAISRFLASASRRQCDSIV